MPGTLGATTSQQPSDAGAQKGAGAYDFTKRRRWADLMAMELVESIVFVISRSTKVLYCQCGGSTHEVLGWRDSDFLDCELTDFINPEDVEQLRFDIEECLRTDRDVPGASYARIRPNQAPNAYPPVNEVLHEFRTYHLNHPEDPQGAVVLLTAKHHYYKNATHTSAIADEKQANIILLQRITELRKQLPPQVASEIAASYASGDASSSIYSSSSLLASRSATLDQEIKGSQNDHHRLSAAFPSNTNAVVPEEEVEDGTKKKKIKKSHGAEQYVCVKCGKTDSPEWRKGPQGPKTLCNACGLRWAKQSKKTEEIGEGKDANELRSTSEDTNSPTSSA
ncbi:GATA-domain-containing protein [Coprinopsis marcescibilis]|uniref:GATA-domain-containing protein n=1 Tax=Coprinopsis marcescibilis TaxID=230819 RepID=A0A5C3LAG1_COPMA|nr:GATA-domain-containing protein [Coprinopsis marcescibilis]